MSPRPHYTRHSALAEALLEHGAAITRAYAERAFGIHALNACVAEGSVRRILPGVFVHAAHTGDRKVRIRAASKWCDPRGAVTGAAAAWAWRLIPDPPARVTVQLPPRLHLESPDWLRIVRPNVPMQVVTVAGIRVVSQADSVVQAWNETTPRSRIGLLADSLRRGYLTAEDVAAAAEVTPRVRARKELHTVLGVFDGGVTSFLEWHARVHVFPQHLFPELTFQYGVKANGRVLTVDACAPDARLALEFDGRTHHSSEHDRLADIARDSVLAALGYTVLRMPFNDLMERPDQCRAIYRRARASRLELGQPPQVA